MPKQDDSGCTRRTFVKNISATAVALAGGVPSQAKTGLSPQPAKDAPVRDLGYAAPVEAQAGKPPAQDLAWLTLTEAARLVRGKKLSPVELTRSCLERIERLNPKLNAFITVTAEPALAQARAAEAEIQRGQWRGPLHGIPIALKDLFDTAGVRTTAASQVFQERVPEQDGEIVRRLKDSGAVLLGKLNMHEFAYGGSTVISYFGPVRNPWSLEHMAGGSSSGSAVAMAAGLCYGSVGSDTGGSIRQPSAYCGTVGIKPTYGRVSTRGVVPLSWLYDHVGPMTRSVADAAAMLQVLAGYDAEDTTSVDAPVPDYTVALGGKKPLRVGVPRTYFYEGLHPEIEAALKAALSVIEKLAPGLREVELPASNDTTILRTESYAYHAENVKKSPALYQPETLKRIVSAQDVPTPVYIQARRQVDQFRRGVQKVFKNVDLLVTPTTPVPPFTIAELLADMDNLRTKEILSLRNTRPFNILGLPTISVPCGFTGSGLPIGMQITGAPWAEANVLQLAHAYEQQTEWHRKHPKLEN